jgi:hypothetical protein
MESAVRRHFASHSVTMDCLSPEALARDIPLHIQHGSNWCCSPIANTFTMPQSWTVDVISHVRLKPRYKRPRDTFLEGLPREPPTAPSITSCWTGKLSYTAYGTHLPPPTATRHGHNSTNHSGVYRRCKLHDYVQVQMMVLVMWTFINSPSNSCM